MILNRLGNKQRIAKDIIKYFPEHKIYIEPFFGAGGMFFNKPKAKYNMVNDIDSDVYNLYNVLLNNTEQLYNEFEQMPIHTDLLKYWKQNKEADPIKKALRFIFLSNLIAPKTGDINRKGYYNQKEIGLQNMKASIDFIKTTSIRFFNEDFRLFIDRIMLKGEERPKEDASMFIYCDPPYLKTANNYSHFFTEQDSIDLFDVLEKKAVKFAMSEFDNDFILNQAKERNLNVIIIGERNNISNRRTEILVTNYQKALTLF
jgi:DNA adenine methylase